MANNGAHFTASAMSHGTTALVFSNPQTLNTEKSIPRAPEVKVHQDVKGGDESDMKQDRKAARGQAFAAMRNAATKNMTRQEFQLRLEQHGHTFGLPKEGFKQRTALIKLHQSDPDKFDKFVTALGRLPYTVPGGK